MKKRTLTNTFAASPALSRVINAGMTALRSASPRTMDTGTPDTGLLAAPSRPCAERRACPSTSAPAKPRAITEAAAATPGASSRALESAEGPASFVPACSCSCCFLLSSSSSPPSSLDLPPGPDVLAHRKDAGVAAGGHRPLQRERTSTILAGPDHAVLTPRKCALDAKLSTLFLSIVAWSRR